MAEALAVVGIVANIAQLVDFGSKILHRLAEFQSSVENVPESFRHIKAKLPLLLHTLQQTKEAIEAGSIRDDTTKVLLPAIEGCWEQIKLLDEVLLKTLPTSGDSWTKRSQESDLDEPTLRLKSGEDNGHYSGLYSDSYIPPRYCFVNFGAIKRYTFRTLDNAFRHGGSMRNPANRAASAQGDLHQNLLRAPLYLFGVIKTL